MQLRLLCAALVLVKASFAQIETMAPQAASNADATLSDSTPANNNDNGSTADGHQCHAPYFNADAGVLKSTNLAILLALPLTYKGVPSISPGLLQLTAAVLAIENFNQRNTSIVPELEDIQDCPIQIDYDKLILLDTGTLESNALKEVLSEKYDYLPNVIVGPYNEIPALELSVMASSLRIPMLSHRATDHNFLLPNKHPMVTQVNPDLYAEVEFLGDYLVHIGRKDYIAVLYAANSDSAIQRLEAFRGVATKKWGIQNIQAFGYYSKFTPISSEAEVPTIKEAVEKLAVTGYRTIVWITPSFDDDVVPVGMEASKHSLDTGNHLWIMAAAMEIDKPFESDPMPVNISSEEMGSTLELPFGSIQEIFNSDLSDDQIELGLQSMAPFLANIFDVASNHNSSPRFMFNSAYLGHSEEGYDQSRWNSSTFMKVWMGLDRTFYDKVQGLNNDITMEEYQKEWAQSLLFGLALGWLKADNLPRYRFPPDDFFSKPISYFTAPVGGAFNLYDAIMSAGLGACHAVANATSTYQPETSLNITGDMLQSSIRSVDFHGATGEVRFGDGFPGSRVGRTATFSVNNVFPTGSFRYVVARGVSMCCHLNCPRP